MAGVPLPRHTAVRPMVRADLFVGVELGSRPRSERITIYSFRLGFLPVRPAPEFKRLYANRSD
jgi:hypothetical protein